MAGIVENRTRPKSGKDRTDLKAGRDNVPPLFPFLLSLRIDERISGDNKVLLVTFCGPVNAILDARSGDNAH
jgi:hypothetical protein